jgi:hypothetical protein
VLVKGLLEGKTNNRKMLFTITFAVIGVVLLGGAVTAVTFLSNPSGNPIATTNPTPTATPSITINQPSTLPQGYINSDKALNTAMPYINQYVAEHNRTIAIISVQFNETFPDWYHTKSGQLLSHPDNNPPRYPAWWISVGFLSTSDNDTFPNYGYHGDGILGYEVGVWADNSQVFYNETIGACIAC